MNHQIPSPAQPRGRRRRMSVGLASFLAIASLLAIGVANASAAWSLQTTPNPHATLNELNDVSCLAGGECFSVGSVGSPSATTAQRWNGTEWKTQPTAALPTPPLGSTGHSLVSISCTSTTACTAVGYQTISGVKKALAERWDGASWKTQEVPGSKGPLQAVTCVSATDCLAVGQTGGSARWNGKEWSTSTAPFVFGTPEQGTLSDLSCTSASFCVAVGTYGQSSLIFSWNGSIWTSQTSPTGSLLGVSCTATYACTAVGVMSGPTGTLIPLITRWDGTKWTTQKAAYSAGAEFAGLSGVSCASQTVCYATGATRSGPNMETLAEVWNGTSWEVQSTPNPVGAVASFFRGVSCISITVCESVGVSRNGANVTTTLAERAS